jgi:hypothetical protein
MGATQRAAAPAAALALLAACSGGGQADYNAAARVPEDEAAAQRAIERAAGRDGAATTATLGVPVGATKLNAARNRALPVDFQGYWGATPDDCELANVSARGRINIDADTIRLFEARARVVALDRRSPFLVVARLRFDGAGGTGERTTELRLDAGGTTLIRTDRVPPLSITYKRC